MKKFGTVIKCRACGCKADFGVFFRFSSLNNIDGSITDTSYIERTCPRCGYRWREKPLYLCEDKNEKAAKSL